MVIGRRVTSMNKLLLAVVPLLAASVLSAHSGIAAAQGGCSERGPALMSIPALHWFGKQIRWGTRGLEKGPIWDPAYLTRPGDGETMVIDGHDVTPVPGYSGGHG